MKTIQLTTDTITGFSRQATIYAFFARSIEQQFIIYVRLSYLQDEEPITSGRFAPEEHEVYADYTEFMALVNAESNLMQAMEVATAQYFAARDAELPSTFSEIEL